MVSPTAKMRQAWSAYECQASKMVVIPFGPDKIRIAPETIDSWKALETVLTFYGYDIRIEDTDSYNCRQMKSGKAKSLHSYGIALDINWNTNHYVDHAGTRPPKFSSKLTQIERAEEVKLGKADTDMTRAMIDAVLAIKTGSGQRVFGWGGDWQTLKDAMHFQIEVTPAQLAAGIDWNTVEGAVSSSPVTANNANTITTPPLNQMIEGDNAMELPAVFFNSVRNSVFQNSLSQSAVDNMTIIVDYWLRNYPTNPINQLAYVLATVRRETGINMRPVRETFATSDAQARSNLSHKKYGKPAGPYGHVYYGRGYVQLTWLENYRVQKSKLGIDLVQYPDKALETGVAIQILVNGMMAGDFNPHGHGLQYYVNATHEDFVEARWTVNRQDHAVEIAGYARAFRDALNASNLQIQPLIAHDEAVDDIQMPPPSNPFPEPPILSYESGNLGASWPIGSSASVAGTNSDPRWDAILTLFTSVIDDNGKLDPTKLQDIFKAAVPQTHELTPINNMLGETVGNLLNGRKTAIGVIGSLLFGLLGGTSGEPTAIAQNAGSVLSPLLTTLGGASPIALPVLAATTLWGLLGKVDKWVRLKK